MDSRHILRALIERLEPEVGHITELDLSYWGDEPPDVRKRIVTGTMHMAKALMEAKAALESEHDGRISSAALICPTFERTGRAMAKKHKEALAASSAAARRQSGGATTGAKNHADAAAFWAPCQARYADLLAGGANAAKALATVVKESDKAGHPISGRAARKWLRQKKVGTQL